MLKLKLQYFGHLMQRADSFEKTLMLGKIEGRRRGGHNRGWDGWMASPTWWTWVWVGSSSWWWTGRPGMLRSMGLQRIGHDWATELNWTESDLTHKVIYKNQHESTYFSSKDTGLERMLWINMLIYWIVKLLSAKTVSVIILALIVVGTWPWTNLSGNKWILNQVDCLC